MKDQLYRNRLVLTPPKVVGNERRGEIYEQLFESSHELPRTVVYDDIDKAFEKWVKDDLKITSNEGVDFPTFTMFSNQRFSEYSQTWQHTDENKNLLLNFKSIIRENNPKKGTLYGNMWNVPGQYFTIEKRKVLDDNGTESLRHTEMMMPTAVDLKYKINIFTTSYKKINEFNELINHLFDSCQVYIWPNGHSMAMSLDNISDESSYQIDDRQFYAQSYDITLKAYYITEEHYRITEVPLRECLDFSNLTTVRRKASVSIEDVGEDDKLLELYFPKGVSNVTFTIDDDFEITDVSLDNVRNSYKLIINGLKADNDSKVKLRNGDEVSIRIRKIHESEYGSIVFSGK